MAINHCAHFGLKMCAYCNDIDLSAHTVASFERCRDNYYIRNGIKRNFECYLVKIFYEALEDVADKIGAVVKRNKAYVGVAQAAIEAQIKLHGHQFPQLSVEFASNCKKFNDSKFQEHYRSVAIELGIIEAVSVHENVNTSDGEMININIVSDEEEPEVQQQVVSSQSDGRSKERHGKTPINNNASESEENDGSDGNEVISSDVVRNLIIRPDHKKFYEKKLRSFFYVQFEACPAQEQQTYAISFYKPTTFRRAKTFCNILIS